MSSLLQFVLQLVSSQLSQIKCHLFYRSPKHIHNSVTISCQSSCIVVFGLLNIFVPFIANLKTTNTQKLLNSHVRMKQQTSRDVCQSNPPNTSRDVKPTHSTRLRQFTITNSYECSQFSVL